MSSFTADGCEVDITSHIELPGQLDQVRPGYGGIGLLEVGPLTGNAFPIPENRLLAIMLEASRAAEGRPVTVLISRNGVFEGSVRIPGENHGGGPGGIRLCLARPDLYRSQLRAVLRAGSEGCFELALPSVGQVSEIIAFKGILAEVRSELEREGLSCRLPEIGIMVEIPAVIPTIKTIVYESRFFIMGKNFLRLLMADDHIFEEKNSFVPFYSQAFLLQIESLMKALQGRKAGVRFCGPFVADPLAVPLLVGLGFKQIIVPPQLIPGIKKIVGNINYPDVRLMAAKAASYWRPEQAREYVRERVYKLRYL